MRILLIYPPPWKIAEPGQKLPDPADGPPPGLDTDLVLSGDILHLPCGLLSLAAQARRSGHAVEVLNLFTFAWTRIEEIILSRQADLFGLSCFSSNRRGTLALARLIRQAHPQAHIAVGGPHATALPLDMLARCSAIDTVIIGEGEATLAELIAALEEQSSPHGIAGTAYRSNNELFRGPVRLRITELDGLAPPTDYASDHILITSRGCPWDCSFCASAGAWGKTVCSHSPEYVFNLLDGIVNQSGIKAVAIKDETFTLDRRRVLAICHGIMQREINFLWSCDTRADTLDEEVLAAMRQAGCVRISLGVESGCEAILRTLGKRIRPADVRRAVALARRFGFQVRLYMIVGAPGETRSSLQESIDFVRDIRPTEVIWNPYTLFPGTRDFAEAVRSGAVDEEIFFTENFFECTPVLGRQADADASFCIDWLQQHQGLQKAADYSAAERAHILERFPDLPAAHLDLAAALYAEGDYRAAQESLGEALQLEHPLPGLCRNLRACIAAQQGDMETCLRELMAAKNLELHAAVERNIEAAQRWAASGGPRSGLPLVLDADCAFEITRPRVQPFMPGLIA